MALNLLGIPEEFEERIKAIIEAAPHGKRRFSDGKTVDEYGYTYVPDYSHAGQISASKDVLEARGVLDLFDEPDLDFFHDYEWSDVLEREEYAEEYEDEKKQFMDKYTHPISHCFEVIAPDGTSLMYGDDTPHGKVGSKEFTLWYNELPLDALDYCDVESWCDG